MLPVEIVPAPGGTLVLRARRSELLILPTHINELKTRKTPKDFTVYFLNEALINRPARKLFEAWLRKDRTLWRRIYDTVQNEMDDIDESSVAEAENPKQKPAPSTPPPEKAAKPKAEKKEEKPAVEKKASKATKESAEKKEKKTATKKAAAAKKTTTKKSAATKTAKKKTSTTSKKKTTSTKKTTKAKKTSSSSAKKKTKKKTK